MNMALGNVTYFTIFRVEVYRILFSPIVGNSLLNTIVMFLFYPMMGTLMESSMGSSMFIWLIGFITLSTNILFNILCLLLSFYMPEALFYSSSGFWVILFGLVTIECMQQPEMPRQLLFIPVNIPSMYFPLALFAFFALFSGPQLDFIISMGIGYLYSKGMLDRFRPSSLYLESLEASGAVLHSISRSRGYVLAGTLGHDAWVAQNATQVTRDGGDARGSYAPVQQSSAHGFGAFSGLGQQSGGGATAGAPEKVDSFPGSGHKLATSGVFSGAQGRESREAIAARRAEMLAQSPV